MHSVNHALQQASRRADERQTLSVLINPRGFSDKGNHGSVDTTLSQHYLLAGLSNPTLLAKQGFCPEGLQSFGIRLTERTQREQSELSG
jgi:hypothetical protein